MTQGKQKTQDKEKKKKKEKLKEGDAEKTRSVHPTSYFCIIHTTAHHIRNQELLLKSL